MDIFVLPSHREGFPRAPMEASAMGLPCIATDIRGCRQTVEHEVTGLLVPRSAPVALADAIRRLAGDPAERRRLGMAARAKAVAEFDERVVFDRLLAGYRRLLAGQAPERAAPPPAGPCHALTVDLEDWHQNYRRATTGRLGPASDSVIRCTHRILDRLDEAGARATFFVVGTVADDQPALVRAIASRGHEIASHSHAHRLLRELSPADLAADIARSKHQLESITGSAVLGFRAPEFSIESLQHPVFELLARLGFAYDSSVVPGPGMRYAIAGAPNTPFPIHTPSGPLVEFPIATLAVLGKRVPLGGSTLRLVGIRRLERGIRQLEAAGASATMYVHPYEFSDEPLAPDRIGLPDLRRARWLLLHNFQTPKIAARVGSLLRSFRFQTLRERYAAL
jgi:polysaccharide deacetylase family protein (PEP-CTERM system associated)